MKTIGPLPPMKEWVVAVVPVNRTVLLPAEKLPLLVSPPSWMVRVAFPVSARLAPEVMVIQAQNQSLKLLAERQSAAPAAAQGPSLADQFAEVTGDGRLRAPAWRGWRPDKNPDQVVREVAG